MYCPNCGSTIADGAKFCPHCGNSVMPAQNNYFSPPPQQPTYMDQQMHQYQVQKNAVRQSETDVLNHMLQYFSKKLDQYESYDYVCEQVNHYARGAKNGLLVWGAIIFTFSLLAVLVAGGILTTAEAPAGLFVYACIFLIPGAAMLAGGILMKVNNRRKYNYFLQEYTQLSTELLNHYRGYPSCPLGPEYSNPRILSAVMQVLQSGRADTIKESLNQVIASVNSRRVNQYLDQVQRSTSQASAPVIFIAARFFL